MHHKVASLDLRTTFSVTKEMLNFSKKITPETRKQNHNPITSLFIVFYIRYNMSFPIRFIYLFSAKKEVFVKYFVNNR